MENNEITNEKKSEVLKYINYIKKIILTCNISL